MSMLLRFIYNTVHMGIMHYITTPFCAFKNIRDDKMSVVVSKYFYQGMSGCQVVNQLCIQK